MSRRKVPHLEREIRTDRERHRGEIEIKKKEDKKER